MFDMQGAVAIVTGSGQGVGREIALTFARSGGRAVVVNDVHLGRAEAVAQEVRELGATALAVAADVTDAAAVQDMVARATAECGPVTVLVNNAGNLGADPSAVESGLFWELDPANWTPVLAVNLLGPMHCARAVLPGMVQEQFGRVITVISDAGRVGEAGLEAYSAAKAGAAGFTRALARAVGRYGITANNIAIAATQTPTTQGVLDDPATLARMMSRYVVRRPGEPTDIAPVALLLASSSGSWITGQTYPVNGGFSFGL